MANFCTKGSSSSNRIALTSKEFIAFVEPFSFSLHFIYGFCCLNTVIQHTRGNVYCQGRQRVELINDVHVVFQCQPESIWRNKGDKKYYNETKYRCVWYTFKANIIKMRWCRIYSKNIQYSILRQMFCKYSFKTILRLEINIVNSGSK